jgi:hypothetical protein
MAEINGTHEVSYDVYRKLLDGLIQAQWDTFARFEPEVEDREQNVFYLLSLVDANGSAPLPIQSFQARTTAKQLTGSGAEASMSYDIYLQCTTPVEPGFKPTHLELYRKTIWQSGRETLSKIVDGKFAQTMRNISPDRKTFQVSAQEVREGAPRLKVFNTPRLTYIGSWGNDRPLFRGIPDNELRVGDMVFFEGSNWFVVEIIYIVNTTNSLMEVKLGREEDLRNG